MQKKRILKDIVMLLAVLTASVLLAVNNKTFVSAGGLYPGGVTGLTILIQRAALSLWQISLPFTPVNLALNLIPVYIGFRYLGKKFTLFSCVMIVLSSVFTDLLPAYTVTEDILLISIFGGLLYGFAISLCLNAGTTSGGTDFISIYLSSRSGTDAFPVIFGFNALILAAAGFLFGWDKALYSIIFQYAATVTLHTLYKKYQQSTFFIVTTKPQAVCEAIYAATGHGATVLEGEGSYEHCARNVVYSVVSSAQAKKVVRCVKVTDPAAFVNEVKTQKLSGYFVQPKEE